MARDADLTVLMGQTAAAAAGALNLYYPMIVPFRFMGFCWGYQTAEANADNTIDFVIASDGDFDGTFDNPTLHTNANTCGLLDSAAIGEILVNMGDAAGAAGAAVAVTPTQARVVAGGTIRAVLTTAGTGTVPAINFGIIGYWLQPLA